MSSYRLASLVLALGACMKIYPDPELPDIEVTWFDGDCNDNVTDVLVTLYGVDDTTTRVERSVTCTDGKTTFADVARERYRVEGFLRAADGTQVGMSFAEVDLRNGWNEEAYLYFGSFNNVRVAWEFEGGATCDSLDADMIMVELAGISPYLIGAPCTFMVHFASAPDGIYTVTARAQSQGVTVAASSPIPDVAVSFDTFTDLGTFVLTPCAPNCP